MNDLSDKYDFIGEFHQGIAIVVKDAQYGGMKSSLQAMTTFPCLTKGMPKLFVKENACYWTFQEENVSYTKGN